MDGIINKVTGIVVAGLMIAYVGVISVGALLNTTALIAAGVSGTSLTLFGVIAIMSVLSYMLVVIPRK